jgi:hypothetical protein
MTIVGPLPDYCILCIISSPSCSVLFFSWSLLKTQPMKRNIMLLMIPVLMFACVQMAPGQLKKEERKVETFTSIDLSISANVFITQENTQKVVVEASENDLKEVVTEVKNGHLKIKTESWHSHLREVNVYISMASLEGIGLSGSGNIVADGDLKVGNLGLAISGSGNIKFPKLTASKIEASISGSGDILIAGPGKAESLETHTSGSGNFNAENFEVGTAEISISGSGNARVNASGHISAHVSGSGDVYYKGNATADIKISGSGKARKI